VLAEIAARHGVTPTQVVVRWHVDHEVVVIPKSANPGRIAADFDIFGFSLTDEELGRIDGLSAPAGSGCGPAPSGRAYRAPVAAVVVDRGQLGDQALKVGAGPGLLTDGSRPARYRQGRQSANPRITGGFVSRLRESSRGRGDR
jgi:Aldo/keto reductase family